jgi:Domain of unknown function (DUF4192)
VSGKASWAACHLGLAPRGRRTARWASVPCRCFLNRWARPFPTTVAQDSLPADPWDLAFSQQVVHRPPWCWALCPQICSRAHVLGSRPQPSHMSSSRKSAHNKPARRKPKRGKPLDRKAAQRRRRASLETPTRLRVRRPDDLLAIIPYLIGFHPEESLVVVLVRSSRVILAARLDLSSDADADELADFIDALAKREGAEALALVGYGAASLPTNRLLTQLMDRLVEQELTDVLYVGHGRWWSLTCADDCCPLAGTPLDLSSHPLCATAVLAGLGTRTNRRELEESVSGPAKDELPRLDAMVETMLAERAELADPGDAARLLASMIDKVLADPNILDEETCLLLGLLVRDVHLRDLAWALLTPTTADDHVRLWGAVVAHVPPTLAAAPLCLLGMAAWVVGAGALLNCCCERLTRVDPDYSMGRVLAEISEQAIPPRRWEEIGRDIQDELRAEFASLSG